MKHRSAPMHGLKALGLEGGDAGTFSAVVSVFGNVDYAGDRVLPGAFAASLDRWKAQGDPIPVVFAHQWDDLDAHVGEVLEAKELHPGDDDLPEELASNGGLWVKFRLDVEEDFAGRLAKRLERRTIREFSFAYDVIDERRSADGANDLVELDVIEVGPCLKGMNPATVLMAKALGADGAKVVDALREMGEGAMADQLSKALPGPAEPDGKKTVDVTFVGSAEELQGALLDALYGWASAEDLGRGGFYGVHLEATYGDHVVATVEGWEDPIGSGTPYEVPYTRSADGEVELGEAVEVVVEASTRTKAYGRRSAIVPAAGGTVAPPSDGKSKDKTPGVEDPPDEDRNEGDRDGGDPADVALDLDALEVELSTT